MGWSRRLSGSSRLSGSRHLNGSRCLNGNRRLNESLRMSGSSLGEIHRGESCQHGSQDGSHQYWSRHDRSRPSRFPWTGSRRSVRGRRDVNEVLSVFGLSSVALGYMGSG